MIKVSELKKIMVPGFQGCFLLNDGNTVDISVNGGNILKLNFCSFPWNSLPDKLYEWGLARLISIDSKRSYDFENGVLIKEIGHGGRRIAGAGKQLGRKPSGSVPKKKICITIDPDILELMKLQPTFKSTSTFIGMVLDDFFDNVLDNGEK